jgi:hypothetical protein
MEIELKRVRYIETWKEMEKEKDENKEENRKKTQR